MSAPPPGVDTGLSAVRELLGHDGADVEVTTWDDETGALGLRLLLDSAECAECVVPRPMLDTLVLDAIRTHSPAVRSLDLDDPRDGGSADG